MNKKIKLLSTAVSIATVGGCVLPLASCTTALNKNDLNARATVEGPEVIRMQHGVGGRAQYSAFDLTHRDITTEVEWSLGIEDESISVEGGFVTWTPEFTKKYGTETSLFVGGKYHATPVRGMTSKIEWLNDEITVQYDGVKTWGVDEGAPYLITDTSSLKVIRDGKVLDRDKYTAEVEIVLTQCTGGDLILQDDYSIQVKPWKYPETQPAYDAIDFGIMVTLKDEPEVYTSLNGLKINLAKCDFNVESDLEDDRIDVYEGSAGESAAKYTLTKNGQDITNDSNVSDIQILAQTSSNRTEPYPGLSYSTETKKISWGADFKEIERECHFITIAYKYTNQKTHQVHDACGSSITFVSHSIQVEIGGDEKDFNKDTCKEFNDHKWSKNVYFRKASSEEFHSPTPLDKKYLTVTPKPCPSTYGKYPEGVTVDVQQIDEDNIKIIPQLGHNLIADKYAFYIEFQYDGPGLLLHEFVTFEIEITKKSIEASGYSEELSGEEVTAGSDSKEWNIKYDDFDGTKNVAAECEYKLVNESSETTIPDGAIYVDKANGKAVTKWKDVLNEGTYKFHFDITYKYKDLQTYTVSSKSIELKVGLATLTIVGAPSSVSATEWVEGTDSTAIKASVKWKDGKERDVTKDAVWTIEGYEDVDSVISIVTDDSKAYINWNNLINRETVPSGKKFHIVANLTIEGRKYKAATSGDISVNITNDSLSMFGGSTKMIADSSHSGEAEKAWSCKLEHGTIGIGDEVKYSLELPDEIEDSVRINNDGLISWDEGIKPTTSSKGYEIKVNASLTKAGCSYSYKTSQTVELLVRAESQKLFEQLSWKKLGEILKGEDGLKHLKEEIWLSQDKTTVGLTKTFTVKQNNETIIYTTRVIGENHDILANTEEQKAALTFEIQDLTYIGEIYDDNSNCWHDNEHSSKLRDAVIGWGEAMLPKDIKDNIKEVKKQCATGKETNDRPVNWMSEKIWLPSATELGATDQDTKVWAKEGTVYDYYKGDDVITKRMKNVQGQASWKGIYWTRSPAIPDSGCASACAIFGNGRLGSMFIDDGNQFIAPCFCL